MPISVRFRVIEHKTKLSGIKSAEKILRRNLTTGLESVGKRFEKSSVSRMRKDTGTTQKSLQVVVNKDISNLGVLVFSDRIAAYIDAEGLPRGIFPPFGEGTPLYRWASRRARGKAIKKVTTEKVPKRSLYQLNENWLRRQRLRGVRGIKSVRKARAGGNKAVRKLRNDSRRIAFLAARAIFRRGIKATHWNRKALEANKTVMVKEIQNAISRAIVEMKRA